MQVSNRGGISWAKSEGHMPQILLPEGVHTTAPRLCQVTTIKTGHWWLCCNLSWLLWRFPASIEAGRRCTKPHSWRERHNILPKSGGATRFAVPCSSISEGWEPSTKGWEPSQKLGRGSTKPRHGEKPGQWCHSIVWHHNVAWRDITALGAGMRHYASE